jgi:hypothetical protein
MAVLYFELASFAMWPRQKQKILFNGRGFDNVAYIERSQRHPIYQNVFCRSGTARSPQ